MCELKKRVNGIEKRGRGRQIQSLPSHNSPPPLPLSPHPRRNFKPTSIRREIAKSGGQKGVGGEEAGGPLEVSILKTNTAMRLSDKSTVGVMR